MYESALVVLPDITEPMGVFEASSCIKLQDDIQRTKRVPANIVMFFLIRLSPLSIYVLSL